MRQSATLRTGVNLTDSRALAAKAKTLGSKASCNPPLPLGMSLIQKGSVQGWSWSEKFLALSVYFSADMLLQCALIEPVTCSSTILY